MVKDFDMQNMHLKFHRNAYSRLSISPLPTPTRNSQPLTNIQNPRNNAISTLTRTFTWVPSTLASSKGVDYHAREEDRCVGLGILYFLASISEIIASRPEHFVVILTDNDCEYLQFVNFLCLLISWPIDQVISWRSLPLAASHYFILKLGRFVNSSLDFFNTLSDI